MQFMTKLQCLLNKKTLIFLSDRTDLLNVNYTADRDQS